MFKEERRKPICPNCGEKEGYMGSSMWNHNYMCCSSECGEELSEKLNELYQSNAYMKIKKNISELKNVLIQMEESLLIIPEDEADDNLRYVQNRVEELQQMIEIAKKQSIR